MSATIYNNVQGGILTIDQAAAYLSIPKGTLYTWRTRRVGFGPRAVKLGGCLRYRRSDLGAGSLRRVWLGNAAPPYGPRARRGKWAAIARTSGVDLGHPCRLRAPGRLRDSHQ